MKKHDVPQDKSNLESTKSKELCYAVNEKGEYTTAHSSGWEPKTIALDNAIAEVNARIENARQNVINNKTSPLEYFMEVHKMDVPILASYVGMWQWRVKRHFKPKVFAKLSNKILQKYADVFEITITELKEIKHGD
ncbi:hypothetical protein JJL45_14950 [Tamlana sp. s12]|uniref:hypothetical protein n=1 Tax=Tamlana sp. s12 TaxID=1630406 RepID=UPI0007FF2CD5|nr:hypothetical protein [Tamlana sp. s12]OBQ54708.1 hypothetical protein VQ01_11215 [Tamlana sp. s12]QQY82204.1 hypothetical protein JJL45_14950 [Tamlana sp. s12]